MILKKDLGTKVLCLSYERDNRGQVATMKGFQFIVGLSLGLEQPTAKKVVTINAKFASPLRD